MQKKGCNCKKTNCQKKVYFFYFSTVNAKLMDYNVEIIVNAKDAKTIHK